ncbi:MAG: helix-turn-helix domain-containing protein [Clostridiales bacterium]|nr:helix-turn-helix domain-containing protein [Clostridiales bacterium]
MQKGEKYVNRSFEKELGLNIRRQRETKQMTQEQLSTKLQLEGCDLTRSAIAKIEVGQRHIYPDEIKLIKEILNVSFDELLDINI